MKIIERYVGAVNASGANTIPLSAVALSSDLGSLLFRSKYAGDLSSVPRLLDAWYKKLIKKRRHGDVGIDFKLIALTSLDYWLNDACQTCKGVAFKRITDTPSLSDIACHACNASGLRRLECPEDIKPHVRDAVDKLRSMERVAGAAAIRKIGTFDKMLDKL